jgi:hypothetical protein
MVSCHDNLVRIIMIEMDVYEFSSDDDQLVANDDEVIVKNKRGKGRAWHVVRVHENISIAKSTIDNVTRKRGRINRGVTIAFYYNCQFRSCGCKIQWRFVTSQTSFEVVEEQSDGAHACHDLLQRNGGRGLNFDQVQIVEDATMSRISKPSSIILYFENTAKALLENGKFLV